MDFITARDILRNSKYETRQARLDAEDICIKKKLDFSNYYYILLMDYQGDVAPHLTGNAILTDYGYTSKLAGPRVGQQLIIDTCKKFGLDYRSNIIEKKFESILDVENFEKALDIISKRNRELEDLEDDED